MFNVDTQKKSKTELRQYELPFYLLLILLFFEYVRPQSYLPTLSMIRPALFVYVLLFISLLFRGKALRIQNTQTKYYFGLVLLMTIHIPIAVNNYWAFEIWKTTCLYFILYLGIVNFVDSLEKLKKLINFGIISIVFCAVIGISKGGRIPYSYASFLGDENDFALVMNMFIPFAYFMFLETTSKWKKALYLGAISSFVAANIISLSRGGFVGLVAAALYCWLRSPKKILTSIILVLGICILSFTAPSQYWEEVRTIKEENIREGTGSVRWYAWKCGWKMFLDNPIIGVGQGNFPWNFEKYEPPEGFGGRLHGGMVAHSIYFTLIPELGIIGTFLFFGILWRSYKDISDKIRQIQRRTETMQQKNNTLCYYILAIQGALFAYLVSGVFLSTLYYPHFWLMIAFIVSAANTTISIDQNLHHNSNKQFPSIQLIN